MYFFEKTFDDRVDDNTAISLTGIRVFFACFAEELKCLYNGSVPNMMDYVIVFHDNVYKSLYGKFVIK